MISELRPCPYCHHPAQPMERKGWFGTVYGVRCGYGKHGCTSSLFWETTKSSRDPQKAYRKWNRECEREEERKAKLSDIQWKDTEMRT